jgi:hypothetical protein
LRGGAQRLSRQKRLRTYGRRSEPIVGSWRDDYRRKRVEKSLPDTVRKMAPGLKGNHFVESILTKTIRQIKLGFDARSTRGSLPLLLA